MKFNPDVPATKDPEWIGQSKPIERPRVDTSLGTLFEGIGQIGSAVIEGTDTLIKQNIQNVASEKATQIRDSFTQQLDQMAAIAKGSGANTPQTAPGQQGPMNLMGSSEVVPPALQDMNGKLTTLVGARDNGKLTETAYYGQLSSLAKSLRTWYPGYRDYIDQQISKVVGVDPANAYIQSRVGDINAMVSAAADDKKHVVNLLMSPELRGSPEAAMYANGIANGTYTAAEGRDYINRVSARNWKLDNDMKANSAEESDQKNQVLRAKQQLNTMATNISSEAFAAPLKLAGFEAPSKVLDIMQQSATGQIEVKPEQWVAIDRYVDMRYNLAKAEMFKKAQERPDLGNGTFGKSHVDIMGAGPVQEEIEKSLYMFKSIKDAIAVKNPGMVNYEANKAKAIQDADDLHMLTQSELADSARKMGAIKRNFGDQTTAYLAQKVLMTKGNVQAIDTYMEHKLGNAIDPTGLMQQPTLKGDLTETENKAKAVAVLGSGEVGDKFTRAVELISDKSGKVPDPIKLNIAKWAFTGDNQGTAAKFGPEFTDKNGKRVAGDLTFYRRVTTPDMAKEIYRLGATDQSIVTGYENWVKDTFGADLFRRHLNDMKEISLQEGQRLTFNGSAFDVVDVNGRSLINSSLGYNRINPVTRSLIRDVNTGIQGLLPIAERSGQPASTYVLQTLRTYGYTYNPTPVKKGEADNLPKQIGDAVVRFYDATVAGAKDFASTMGTVTGGMAKSAAEAAKGALESTATAKQNEFFKTVPMQYMQDENTPTLQEWLSNPNYKGAPPASTKPMRGNLSDEDILGMDTVNIPEGVNPADFTKQLMKRKGR